jgi:hypothetical protein
MGALSFDNAKDGSIGLLVAPEYRRRDVAHAMPVVERLRQRIGITRYP